MNDTPGVEVWEATDFASITEDASEDVYYRPGVEFWTNKYEPDKYWKDWKVYFFPYCRVGNLLGYKPEYIGPLVQVYNIEEGLGFYVSAAHAIVALKALVPWRGIARYAAKRRTACLRFHAVSWEVEEPAMLHQGLPHRYTLEDVSNPKLWYTARQLQIERDEDEEIREALIDYSLIPYNRYEAVPPLMNSLRDKPGLDLGLPVGARIISRTPA